MNGPEMNEQDLLDRLDARGRKAAAGLVAATATIDLPPAPTGPQVGNGRSPRSWLPLAAIAAAVILVAGAVLLVNRKGHKEERPTGVNTVDPRPFQATQLPDGFHVTDAVRTDSGAMADAIDRLPGTFRTWGPSDDRPGLGVGVASESGRPTFGDELKVAGHQAFYAEGKIYGRHSLAVFVGTQLELYVSPELARDQLVRIAERARLTGDRVDLDDGSLPAGWHLLAEDKLGSVLPFSGLFAFSGPGNVVGYQKVSGHGAASALAAVASGTGDTARLYEIRTLFVESSDTEVRGHPAIAGTFGQVPAPRRIPPPASVPDGPAETAPSPRLPESGQPVLRVLTWEERPGELIRVSGYGLTADELQQIAASVEPMSDAAFRTLVERAASGELDPDQSKLPLVGTGRFKDGQQWYLRGKVTTNGGSRSIETSLRTTGGGSGGGGSSTQDASANPGPFLTGVSSNVTASSVQTSGLLRDDVARVELEVDGRRTEGAQEVSGNGLKGWVAEVPQAATRAEVVAYDANDKELGRASIDASQEKGSGSSSSGSSSGSSGSVGATTVVVPTTR